MKGIFTAMWIVLAIIIIGSVAMAVPIYMLGYCLLPLLGIKTIQFYQAWIAGLAVMIIWVLSGKD